VTRWPFTDGPPIVSLSRCGYREIDPAPACRGGSRLLNIGRSRVPCRNERITATRRHREISAEGRKAVLPQYSDHDGNHHAGVHTPDRTKTFRLVDDLDDSVCRERISRVDREPPSRPMDCRCRSSQRPDAGDQSILSANPWMAQSSMRRRRWLNGIAYSNCRYPMDRAGAPMFQGNNRLMGFNFYIMVP